VIEVKRHHMPAGYRTRHWAAYVDEELLAVDVYRNGR